MVDGPIPLPATCSEAVVTSDREEDLGLALPGPAAVVTAVWFPGGLQEQRGGQVFLLGEQSK